MFGTGLGGKGEAQEAALGGQRRGLGRRAHAERGVVATTPQRSHHEESQAKGVKVKELKL